MIKNVVGNSLCSGCGACTNVTPERLEMKLDNTGYLRPSGNLSLIPTVDLEEFCPGLVISRPTAEEGVMKDAIWGNIAQKGVCFSTDEKVRFKASSGGGVTGLCSYLLESKTVAGVLHVGVKHGTLLELELKVSTSVEEVLHNSGSRYAPSAPLENILSIVDGFDGTLAFVGKPCDVSALRLLQNSLPSLKRIELLISFMCAGVPSMEGNLKLLSHMGVDQKDLSSFKYRGDGWPGYACATKKNGEEVKLTYNESWGKVLNRFLQHRCKICVDGIGESADIVFADAWDGDSKGFPDFSERVGKSLFIARTRLGASVFTDASSTGYLSFDDFDLSSLDKIQPFQHYRKVTAFSRLLGHRFVFGAVTRVNHMGMFKLFLVGGLAKNIKAFLGSLSRAYRVKRDA
ncbi:MAG: Coenzyme F420 hydrogenase/dehydrogenase, beta subunit C-terminal domain [Colwellia sp.]